MDILIGLGNVGHKLTKAFSKHPQYKIVTIDHEPDATISVSKQDHPEKYEANFPDISSELGDVDGHILFVVSGASIISGASLRIFHVAFGVFFFLNGF